MLAHCLITAADRLLSQEGETNPDRLLRLYRIMRRNSLPVPVDLSIALREAGYTLAGE